MNELRTRRLFLPLHAIAMALVVLACLAAIASGAYALPSAYVPVSVTSAIAICALMVYLRYAVGLSWMSGSMMYLLLFWLLHFGLTFTSVVYPSALESSEVQELAWLAEMNTRVAMIVAVIGAAGFVFAAGLFARPVRETPGAAFDDAADGGDDPTMRVLGWVLMAFGFGVVLYAIYLHGGTSVFGMGYYEVRRRFSEPPDMQTAVEVSQLGCLFALAGASRRWVAPMAAWTLAIGIPMLALGLRNLAMLPLITFVVVLRVRGIRMPRMLVAAGVIALTVLFPFLRVIRNVGVQNREEADVADASPLQTFTELGGSLRATKAYIDRIEAGDPLLLGASYWAPFDRQVLSRIIPDAEQVPYDDDVRVPGRLVSRYEGAVGTSATGEAYYNFGAIGPFIYFGAVGALFGWLERRRRLSPERAAILGAMMIVFYFNIRAEWINVPVRIAGVLAMIATGRLLRAASGRATPRPESVRPSDLSSSTAHP